MNWTQHFELIEKRKQKFRKYALLLIAITVIFFQSSFHKSSLCTFVNASMRVECEIVELRLNGITPNQTTSESLPNESIDVGINETWDTESEDGTSIHPSSGETGSRSLKSVLASPLVVPLVKDYLWPDCACNATGIDGLKFMLLRFVKTPLILITAIAAAYLMSWLAYLRERNKIEHPKKKKEEAK